VDGSHSERNEVVALDTVVADLRVVAD